jgi:hypothetical protein
LSARPATVAPGGTATLAVTVQVRAGYHVQANPVLNPQLIPIVLKVLPAAGLSPGKPAYPAGTRIRLRGSSEDLAVLDGYFEICLPLVAEHDASEGALTLTGTLVYQACDDRHCLLPRTVTLALPVRVEAAR